jgi:hypothetical protein
MFDGGIEMAKLFSEYGLLGLALFTSILVINWTIKKNQKEMSMRYEQEKEKQSREYEQMNKLIETIAGKQEQSIVKLCDKLDKLIDSNFDTQVLNKQLAVRLELGDSQVYKAIIGFSESIEKGIIGIRNKIESQTCRIDERMTQQDKKIDEVHGFIERVYGNKIPIGMILVNKGYITKEQLDEVLLEQKNWRDKT